MRALVVVTLGLAAPLAFAGETDNFYAWRSPPRDSTAQLTLHIEGALARGLADVNAWPGARGEACHDVAHAALARLFVSGMWFVVGATEAWGFDYVPRTNSEYVGALVPVSVYRFARRPFIGAFLPLDPTTRIAGVNVGLDKLGHFLVNGGRYYDVYREARARGASEDEALGEAIELGIEQESGILGLGASRIFSYADLEANYQGLELYRWLCEGDAPALVEDDEGRWRLTRPLELARFISPCWDETFLPNAYHEIAAPGARRGIAMQCPLLDEPQVIALRRSYRARGCKSYSHRYLSYLVERGELPDPRPYDVERVCSSDGS